MEGITRQEEGEFENWVPVFAKSPFSSRYLVDSKLNILGYWHFVALKPRLYKRALKGTLVDGEITSDEIYSLNKRGHYNMYFVEIVITPELIDTDAIIMLNDSLYASIYDFATNGVFFDEMILNAFTKYGLKRALDLGKRRFVRAGIDFRAKLSSLDLCVVVAVDVSDDA